MSAWSTFSRLRISEAFKAPKDLKILLNTVFLANFPTQFLFICILRYIQVDIAVGSYKLRLLCSNFGFHLAFGKGRPQAEEQRLHFGRVMIETPIGG